MDFWGRTGGFSLVLPYALIDASAGPFRATTNGFSDVGFLWQMNLFWWTGADARTVSILYSADLLKFPSFGDDAARNVRSDLSDQS
jgi:hypothetical protein